MKKLSLITRISIAIFLFIMSLALALAIPVYRRLETVVDKYTQKFCDQVTELTGLTLSYDSISPSVLAYLGIKGIKASDSQGRIVTEIKSTHIKYKLLPLLQGKYDSIVKGVSINGVTIDIDVLAEFIQKLVQTQKPPEIEKPPQTIEDIYNQINLVLDYIPPNISVKNLDIKYIKGSLNTSLLVKEIRVLNSEHKESIELSLKSNVTAVYGNKINAKGELNLDGSLTKNLENSYAYINIANFTQGVYKLNKFNFLVSYKDKKLDFKTVQNVMPLSLSAAYDLVTSDAQVVFQSDKLSPVSVFSNATSQKSLKALKDMSVTLKAAAQYNVNNGELGYYSDGTVFVPETLIPGAVELNYSLNGDDTQLTLNRFNVEGPELSGDVDFTFIFKTLQLSGIADLRHYNLPNGNTIATEVYFDPLDNAGFMIFSPQIFIGERSLTAMQARVMPQSDSIDFDFEINDYTHIDEDNQGVIKADGSYLQDSNYIQTSFSLNSIYLETILGIVKEVMPQKQAENIEKVLANTAGYMFSGDAYVSTDFKSVSYNLPYLVLANTQKDNQFALISLDGNEQSINLSRFNLIFGSVALDASASLDVMPGSSDKFYTIDIISSSIPYHFSGAIMPEVLTITGDYGTDAQLRLGKNNAFEGYASVNNFPFVIKSNTYIVSLDTTFDYTKEQGPQVSLQRFQLEQDDPSSSVNPRLEFSGSGTKYGAQINNIAYTDLYSSLTGNSDLTVNFDKGILNSAGIQMNLKDSLSDESILIDAAVSNPDNVVLSGDNVFNSLYVNAMLQASHFSLNRFMRVKNDNNELTASAFLSGTLEHPYATVSVDKIAFLLNEDIVSANGSAILEERDLTINSFSLDGGKWRLDNFTGNLSLSTYTGLLTADFTTNGQKNIVMPLELSVTDSYVPDNSLVPEFLTAKLSSPGLGGTLFKKPVPFDIFVNYTKDFITFYSSENLGLTGTFNNDEGLYATWQIEDMLSTEVTGSFKKTDMYIKLSNVNVNLNTLLRNLTLDEYMLVERGLLKGSVTMRGPFDSPEFKGALSIANPIVVLPSVFEQKISTDKILITAANNEFNVAETEYMLKNTPKFSMSSRLYMNKWSVDRFELKLATLKNQYLPIRFKNPLVSLTGDTECNCSLSLENKNISLSGSIFVENLDVVSDIAEISNVNANQKDTVKDISLTTDLHLQTGTHASLNFNPLLRCVFVPRTVIDCKIDTASNTYQLDGNLQLKSGDVAYLNRNFYIKEGNIKFNPQDITNPLVTIRAETREKDSNGETIRIILSAENQYLLDFNPRFSSVPAKSENEIRLLLGQIVLADSESVGQLVVSAGEYYLQSTVVRNLENKLRDLLNFDIFSVRTNILQNTINLSSQRNKTKELTVGNFFDNSTVYIGKYIGSALYVDAMLNMSASDYTDADYLSANNILFQPEFGLELELSVVNIRWDMAWNLTPGLQFQSYIPSTSVSLSWKFTF